jgi:AraC-like DNA-binding protein
MSTLAPSTCRIQLFRHPYDRFHAYEPAACVDLRKIAGAVLLWRLEDSSSQETEFDELKQRPPALPLIVLLPPPRDIRRTLPLLNAIGALHPRAVLPAGPLGTPDHLRHVLAAPPLSLADAVTSLLMRRGVVSSRTIRREVHRIFELAPETPSIARLARRLYLSRRTLGRHFADAGLPVPSHWLQFARLLHVSINLQNETTAVFRIAARAGYPDGFTMSNQMKRLIGVRPTEVRAKLGWEWVVEAWLTKEHSGAD